MGGLVKLVQVAPKDWQFGLLGSSLFSRHTRIAMLGVFGSAAMSLWAIAQTCAPVGVFEFLIVALP